MNDLMVQKIKVVSECLLSGSDVKRAFEKNYIETLIKLNPELAPRYLVDFIHKAQLTGANPALNQIHLTTYNKKVNGRYEKVGVPVFSYHFFLNVANQTGEYEGVEVDSGVEKVFDPVTGEEKNQLVSTAIVKRKNKGSVKYKARWGECVATDKYGAPNYMWKSKPYVMLEKTAIANALRWAFPEALSGMYISEEIAGETAKTGKDDAIEVPRDNYTKNEKVSLTDDLKEKNLLINSIKNKCGELTKGFSITEKSSFIKEHLEVIKFKDIETSKLDKIKEINAKLKEMKITEILNVKSETPSFKLGE